MRRYLIDENLSPAYHTQLLDREPTLTILRVGDVSAPARGTQDPEILKWCERNNFILVTNDPNTIPKHLLDHLSAGHHVPGIIIVNSNVPTGTILDDLILIAGASNEDEYIDQIVFIPLK